MQTVEGQSVEIIDRNKAGMSIFKIYGLKGGLPCHWTTEGKYRMDGLDDPRDIKDLSAIESTRGISRKITTYSLT